MIWTKFDVNFCFRILIGGGKWYLNEIKYCMRHQESEKLSYPGWVCWCLLPYSMYGDVIDVFNWRKWNCFKMMQWIWWLCVISHKNFLTDYSVLHIRNCRNWDDPILWFSIMELFLSNFTYSVLELSICLPYFWFYSLYSNYAKISVVINQLWGVWLENLGWVAFLIVSSFCISRQIIGKILLILNSLYS